MVTLYMLLLLAPIALPMNAEDTGSGSKEPITELNINEAKESEGLAITSMVTARGAIKLLTIKGKSECTSVLGRKYPIWRGEGGEKARRVLWLSAEEEAGVVQIITRKDKSIDYLYFSDIGDQYETCDFKVFSETLQNQVQHKRVNVRSSYDLSTERKEEYWDNSTSENVKPPLNCMYIKVAIDNQDIWSYKKGGELCLQVARDKTEKDPAYLLVTLGPSGTVIVRYTKQDGQWTETEKVFTTGDNLTPSVAALFAIEIPGLYSSEDVTSEKGVEDESPDTKNGDSETLAQEPQQIGGAMREQIGLPVAVGEDDEGATAEDGPEAPSDDTEEVPKVATEHGGGIPEVPEKDTVASLLHMDSANSDEDLRTKPGRGSLPPLTPTLPRSQDTRRTSAPKITPARRVDGKVGKDAEPGVSALAGPIYDARTVEIEAAGRESPVDTDDEYSCGAAESDGGSGEEEGDEDTDAKAPRDDTPEEPKQVGKEDDEVKEVDTPGGKPPSDPENIPGQPNQVGKEDDEEEGDEDTEVKAPRDDTPEEPKQVGKEDDEVKEVDTPGGKPGSEPETAAKTPTDNDIIPKDSEGGMLAKNPNELTPMDEPAPSPREPIDTPVVLVHHPGSEKRHSLRGDNMQGDETIDKDRGSQNSRTPGSEESGLVDTMMGDSPSAGAHMLDPGKQENGPSGGRGNHMIKMESYALCMAIAFMTVCALEP